MIGLSDIHNARILIVDDQEANVNPAAADPAECRLQGHQLDPGPREVAACIAGTLTT
jgi:hypothetical protein